MAEAHVAAGDRCFVDEEYDEAVKHYSKALELEPSSNVYEARSNANLKLENYVDAVQDASKAIELDGKNSKACLRKGIACFHLEEYETALQCFEQGQQLAPDSSQFRTWIRKCKAELDEEADTVGPSTSAPAAAAPAAPASAPPAAAVAAPAASAAPAAPPAAPPAAAPAPSSTQGIRQALAPAAPETFVGKFRHQWYQIGSKVVVDIYAKKQPKDAVSAQLSNDDSHLTIKIKAQPGSSSSNEQQQQEEDYVLDLDLFAKVLPEVQVEVLSTKVEVSMVKAQPNINWRSLEKGGDKGLPAAGVGVAASAVGVQQQGAPRLYPSSKGPKDWSKVEAEVKELEEKGELDDGDPLGNFFKKIFSQGDEDTRRAMMKSYVESNGTVLSTNWKEVGSKKIECTPPEGAELHKWSENI